MLLTVFAPLSCKDSHTHQSQSQNIDGSLTTKPEASLPIHTKSGDHNVLTIESKHVEIIRDLGPWHELSLVSPWQDVQLRWQEFLRIDSCIIPFNQVPAELRQFLNPNISSARLFRINNTTGKRLLWLNLEIECGARNIQLTLVDSGHRPIGTQYKLIDLPDDCEAKTVKVLRAAEK
jgi:hypothetical protein